MDHYIEDLEFVRRTEEAYQRHESGDFIEMDEKEFLEELENLEFLDLYHKDNQ